ncbi:MAG: hypothetical protein IH987_16740 [Planctomycetes bacterium]|nr:hypothetical protein [Planctomycetota bacterium]
MVGKMTLLSACSHIVVLDRGKVTAAGSTREILPTLFGAAPLREVEKAEV